MTGLHVAGTSDTKHYFIMSISDPSAVLLFSLTVQGEAVATMATGTLVAVSVSGAYMGVGDKSVVGW